MVDKLILALDVKEEAQALTWADRLHDKVGFFKIGKQLFTSTGPTVVKEIIKRGGHIFLDLKFHDIPNTVAAASIEAVRLGVKMFNVHALGGYEMMARAAEATHKEAEKLGIEKPVLIAVTILTSTDESGLKEVGILEPIKDEVRRLALLAQKAGLDGVVASPQEISLVKESCGSDFVVVTPGVRPAFASLDDQKRVMTPYEAVKAGADYLVIGRPITNSEDPVKAADLIAGEMCQE
ncbi:MAG: orotidine-5'-phosphate decarboxylase [Proteobacteria bacterium]|nr:orotidine-5'-phosphate decarboxylase [Pseudomonadota bacterium]